MKKFSLSGPTLWPDGTIHESTLLLEGEWISSLRHGLDSTADIVTRGVIAPGFIDLQVNGAYGCDFSGNGRSLPTVSARLPETGVTSFLPTVITSAWEDYSLRMREIRQAQKESEGARPLGVHMEGPYLQPSKKGAHNQDFFRLPKKEEVLEWAEEPVRIVTLAPELPGALETIAALSRKGILVSLGHSNATYDQALAGFRAGARWVTHLFNAMSSFGHRDPGLPGAAITSPYACGLIADGVHTHSSVIRLVFQAKGASQITLVTDANEAMGMPPGRYRLSDREVIVDESAARLADKTLAGSILKMDQAVRNAISFTGCTLAEALTMAGATPAGVLGCKDKGSIVPGYLADLVVLDEKLQVAHTLVGGKPVFSAKAGS